MNGFQEEKEEIIKMLDNMKPNMLWFISNYIKELNNKSFDEIEHQQGLEVKYTEFVLSVKEEVKDRFNEQGEITIEIEGDKLKSIDEIGNYFSYISIVNEIKEDIQKHLRGEAKCYINNIRKKDIKIIKTTRGIHKKNEYSIMIEYTIVIDNVLGNGNPKMNYIFETCLSLELSIEDRKLTIGKLTQA